MTILGSKYVDNSHLLFDRLDLCPDGSFLCEQREALDANRHSALARPTI